MYRRRGRLDWSQVAALRRVCPRCHALRARGCVNYKGQRKQTCQERLRLPQEEANVALLTEPPSAAELVQRDLF